MVRAFGGGTVRGCLAILLATAGSALLPSSSLAWGDIGHETVGLIADHYLTPDARTVLVKLLGPTDPDMPADIATRATWADKYRESSSQRKAATRQWHFVDLEMGAPDMAQTCFGHLHNPPNSAMPGDPNDCVVDKIEQFISVLQSSAASPAERQIAVQFLLHFVGDVHQPLHSSDNHDAGGNSTYVVFNNRKTPIPLHSFWDVQAVTGNGSNAQAVAAKALSTITPTFCRQALDQADAPTAPEQWATEAYTISNASAYGGVPSSPAGTGTAHERDGSKTVQYYVLSPAYVEQAHEVALSQLSKAGIRLAEVLNQALAHQSVDCG